MEFRFEQEIARRDIETLLSNHISMDSVILDIGCSVGRIEKLIAPLVKEVYGVDVSGKAIRLGRRYLREHSNCYLHVIKNGDLSVFEDERFDFIFSLGTFQHMPVEDCFVYLVESHRCLKPGGAILFEFESLRSQFDQFAYRALMGDRTVTRLRYYTPDQLRTLFERVGYQNCSVSERLAEHYRSGKIFVTATR